MVHEPSVVENAVTVAGAIHRYAKGKGWNEHAYWVFMAFRDDIETLRIVVLAQAFEGRSAEQEYNDYDDVMDMIEEALGERPRGWNAFSLVLDSLRWILRYRPYPRLGPSETEINEGLINQGRVRKAPGPDRVGVPQA